MADDEKEEGNSILPTEIPFDDLKGHALEDCPVPQLRTGLTPPSLEKKVIPSVFTSFFTEGFSCPDMIDSKRLIDSLE